VKIGDRSADTHWLSHARFEPAARLWPLRGWALARAIALLLVLAVFVRGVVAEMWVTSAELAAAQTERELLAAEVERLRMQLAVEGETRSQLEQHSAELNSQVAELTRKVEFLTARKATVARVE
jgi:hypothetical protein